MYAVCRWPQRHYAAHDCKCLKCLLECECKVTFFFSWYNLLSWVLVEGLCFHLRKTCWSHSGRWKLIVNFGCQFWRRTCNVSKSRTQLRFCTDILIVPCICHHRSSYSLGCLCSLCVWLLFGVFNPAWWSYTVKPALILQIKFVFNL